MTPIRLALFVLVACSGKERKGNMEPATPTTCTTRQCLEQNEGQVIDVEGAYVFPKQQAFAVNKLALKDGTTIVLSPPKNELRLHFADANDGRTMRIRGLIFTGLIPEQYGVIGRTAEPHLLELERIDLIGTND
jgi:hypothetical protein